MTATMARMSTAFLPTIKCSDCNAEIEISAMGDHVCAKGEEQVMSAYCGRPDLYTVPVLSGAKYGVFSSSFKPSIPPAKASAKRPLKAPPARIDASFASEYRAGTYLGCIITDFLSARSFV